MNSSVAWQVRRYLQEKTAYEHMRNTEEDKLREDAVLALLNDPSNSTLHTGEKVVHMYLNECRMGKTQEWYVRTQEAFLKNYPHWSSLFGTVVQARATAGSKKQKNNVLGDWLALSHLQGSPRPFETVVIAKNHSRDRRVPASALQPTDQLVMTCNPPKDHAYSHVFELLYSKHHKEHNAWNAMLARLPVAAMTATVWDAYIGTFQDPSAALVNPLSEAQWQMVLTTLSDAKHASVLGQHLVAAMIADNEHTVNKVLSHDYGTDNNPFFGPVMSYALYEALDQAPQLRQKIDTLHLVHAINADPRRLAAEMDFSVSGNNNAWSSRYLFNTVYFKRLLPQIQMQAIQMIAAQPQTYHEPFEALLTETGPTILGKESIELLFSTAAAQARLVEQILSPKGAHALLLRYAELNSDVSSELAHADFEKPHQFENVLMRYLTPNLSYEEALHLDTMADSLGCTAQDALLMYQTALEGNASKKTLSIDQLVGDEPGLSA